MDYDINRFVHVPMFTYNKVMQLFELTGVIEYD